MSERFLACLFFITIIPLFVSGFPNSVLLIGLILAIPHLGWQLPRQIGMNFGIV